MVGLRNLSKALGNTASFCTGDKYIVLWTNDYFSWLIQLYVKEFHKTETGHNGTIPVLLQWKKK